MVAVTELAVKPVIAAKAPSMLSPAWGTLPRPDTTIVVPPLAGPVAGTTVNGLGGAGGTGTVLGVGVVGAGVVGVVGGGAVVGDAPAVVVGSGAVVGEDVGRACGRGGRSPGVKVSGFDGTLSPKAVYAVTSNWYAVPLVRPPTVTPVAVVCATNVESRYRRYPVAPGTADHCRVTLASPADPIRFIGPAGGGGRVVVVLGAPGVAVVVGGVAVVVGGVVLVGRGAAGPVLGEVPGPRAVVGLVAPGRDVPRSW